jgi:hypothetical protein
MSEMDIGDGSKSSANRFPELLGEKILGHFLRE